MLLHYSCFTSCSLTLPATQGTGKKNVTHPAVALNDTYKITLLCMKLTAAESQVTYNHSGKYKMTCLCLDGTQAGMLFTRTVPINEHKFLMLNG